MPFIDSFYVKNTPACWGLIPGVGQYESLGILLPVRPIPGAWTQPKQLMSPILSEDSNAQKPGVHGHMLFDMHKNEHRQRSEQRQCP